MTESKLSLDQLKHLANEVEVHVPDGHEDSVYEVYYAAMFREVGIKTELRPGEGNERIVFKKGYREFRILNGRAFLSGIPLHARLQLQRAGIDFNTVTSSDIMAWRYSGQANMQTSSE